MNLSLAFIRGLQFGLEYVDLDEEDAESMSTDANLMVILNLGLFRLVYLNGSVADE